MEELCAAFILANKVWLAGRMAWEEAVALILLEEGVLGTDL